MKIKFVSSILILFLLILTIGCAASNVQITYILAKDELEGHG